YLHVSLKEMIMKKNTGGTDKLIRIVLAALFAVLYFTGTVTGTAGVVLLVLGGIFVATSFVSFCPLYAFVGANTCKVKDQKN
ncbi:MAG: DUF2892 domain-containing protein, partial [Panacibacter sp.]